MLNVIKKKVVNNVEEESFVYDNDVEFIFDIQSELSNLKEQLTIFNLKKHSIDSNIKTFEDVERLKEKLSLLDVDTLNHIFI